MLSAWTWSEDFQLHTQFEELIDELNEYGFTEVSNDISLLLRCTAAILTGSSKPEQLVSLNGSAVRENFDKVLNGIRGALDFIGSEFNAPSIENLPYQNLLVPLAVFFAGKDGEEVSVSSAQRGVISRWLWRASYSRRYSSGVYRNMDADVAEIKKLKTGSENKLDQIAASITADIFIESRFLISSVSSKTFILMLAQELPRNFVSGLPVDLDKKLQRYNRKEFHHLMPKSFLQKSGQDTPGDSCLANFCFIYRADNREIGGVAPSRYREKMATNVDEVLASHICPNALFDDNYKNFTEIRSEMLRKYACELCGIDV